VAFSLSSRGRLTDRDLNRFPDDTLFHRIARTVCHAGCLPRKELYEAWEVARRVRRVFRGGRIVDLCAAHGLLGHVLLLLDDTSPAAVIVDKNLAPSSEKIHRALVEAWPRLAGRVMFVTEAIERVELGPDDIAASIHACGALTDRILDLASAARARVAVLPCCRDDQTCNPGDLGGWMNESLAIDVMRAMRLREAGYRIWTQRIPETITPENRLLLGAPAAVR
jgi:methyltransferase family protein